MNTTGAPTARGTVNITTPPSKWSTPSTFSVAK